MVLPVSELPDDVDALKAMVLAMAREQAANEARIAVTEARLVASEAEVIRLQAVEAAANERIANLTTIMKVLQRTQNGTRSERLHLAVNDEQVSFALRHLVGRCSATSPFWVGLKALRRYGTIIISII